MRVSLIPRERNILALGWLASQKSLALLLDAATLAQAMTAIARIRIDVPTMRARTRAFTVEVVAPQWHALFDGFRKANDAAICPTQLTGVGIQLADTTNWPRATL